MLIHHQNKLKLLKRNQLKHSEKSESLTSLKKQKEASMDKI